MFLNYSLFQGIRAVIAESYERIHRSNLVGMGVAPLQYKNGQNADTLGLSGKEAFSINIPDDCKPGQTLTVHVINFYNSFFKSVYIYAFIYLYRLMMVVLLK